MKYLIAFLFLFVAHNIVAQLDSLVTYVNDTASLKAVYNGQNTFFYKKDSSNKWELYGKWFETETEIYFYSYDSLDNEYLTYRVERYETERFSYYVDSAGNEELVANTIYYGRIYIPTQDYETPISKINVRESNRVIYVTADDVIIEVKMYDVTGRLLLTLHPNTTELDFNSIPGIIFVVINTNNEEAVKKLIIY
jgi:hypothetical protein